jgi:PD-(D/E)XK endonuclease
MNTKSKGQITEGAVMLSLIRKGKTVLLPYGENQPYDFVIDDGVCGFKKVQCKTARFKNGCVEFNTYSVLRDKITKGYKRVYYGDKVDFFGVYCAQIDKVYLVPVDGVATSGGLLRVTDRTTAQFGGAASRWAAQYEI